MFENILLLIVGFALLIKGADYLVDGASSLAKRLGIADIVVGLTIVAFGTSTPELIVNIMASLKGNTDISIGNVVGSNIANILLILGISAFIYPLIVKRATAWKEIPLSILAAVAILIMANDVYVDGSSASVLSRIDGLVLFLFFLLFMSYIITLAKEEHESAESHKVYSLFKSIGMIFFGFSFLALGGHWVVNSAVAFARGLGVSEMLIGLTIVAVGTSLPELATSAMAAYKRNSDIAIGNIVGSNIFNIFWILGISAIVKPLPFSTLANFDLFFLLGISTLLFIFCFTQKRYQLDKMEGIVFILLYVGYVGYLIMRG